MVNSMSITSQLKKKKTIRSTDNAGPLRSPGRPPEMLTMQMPLESEEGAPPGRAKRARPSGASCVFLKQPSGFRRLGWASRFPPPWKSLGEPTSPPACPATNQLSAPLPLGLSLGHFLPGLIVTSSGTWDCSLDWVASARCCLSLCEVSRQPRVLRAWRRGVLLAWLRARGRAGPPPPL